MYVNPLLLVQYSKCGTKFLQNFNLVNLGGDSLQLLKEARSREARLAGTVTNRAGWQLGQDSRTREQAISQTGFFIYIWEVTGGFSLNNLNSLPGLL